MLLHSLDDLYWLGGSPCSGKSTVAEAIVSKYQLRLFKTDDYLFEHMKQADPVRQPVMYQQSQMTWDEIWMRDAKQQAQEEQRFYQEEFPMLLHELNLIPTGTRILIEGCALLPSLMNQLKIPHNRIAYLVPTKEFQVFHYAKRGFIHGILSECLHPDAAFANWMERDALFARQVFEDAAALNMLIQLVDGTKSVGETISELEEHYEFKK